MPEAMRTAIGSPMARKGVQEHAAFDQRNGIVAGLTRAAVEALF